MFTPKYLPAELLAYTFHYLARKELYQCLLVSHLWSIEAEARLYSDATLNQLLRNHTSLIQSLKSRKHFLRRVHWRSHNGGEVAPADLLDILFDHQPENPGTGSSLSFVEQQMRSGAALSYPLGPNRPALTHFSYSGSDRSWGFFDSILYRLTSLTTLDLLFSLEGRALEAYIVDMDRILTAFPHLKRLSILGMMLKYSPTKGAGLKDRGLVAAQTDDDATTGTGAQHPLESFTFNTSLMRRTGPDAFTFFRRLGNLKKIHVSSQMDDASHVQLCRPWAFGRALKRYCPKIESIGSYRPVVLWLFDLSILPSNKVSHLAALVPEIATPDISGMSARQVQMLMINRVVKRLRDQELQELLVGKDVEPFFPQLKSLILGYRHSFSAQDLISLGVQARHLTHVEIDYQFYVDYALGMYDKDDPAAATAVTVGSSEQMLIENRRLRKRRGIDTQDILLFLQLCPKLCHFSLTKISIPFKDLVDVGNKYNNSTTTTSKKEEAPAIRPWACEGTLETLKIGFELSEKDPEAHRLVWSHLGRFKKLRSLTFVRTALPQNCSALIPSFSHGVECLFVGGSLGKTLQEIRQLTTWWKVQDRRELVLWLARSCPRLMVLGLVYNREYMVGEQGALYTAFLEDEETFAVIFGNLTRPDIHQCPFVSRLWHAHAEAQLYSDVTIDARETTRNQLRIPALKTRRHLLRRVEWLSDGQEDSVFEVDLLDILLGHRTAVAATDIAAEDRTNGLDADSSYCVDLEEILDTYPHLKVLCLDGPICQYKPIGRVEDSDQCYSEYATGPGQHRLEELTFAPSMMNRLGSEAFMCLERLENLRKIRVRSEWSYSDCAQGCRTWEFGRALKQHCPKLEAIDIDGPAIFWFFDLPILTHDQIRHITSLTDQLPIYPSVIPEKLAQRLREDSLRLWVLDQEQHELLESKSATPLFPRLKTLILGRDHSLSLQDLFSFGVQAKLLTHLEINMLSTRSKVP
ncbi:hypothetical protein BGW39_004022 [Mortierella sp. 14UC]|nr:hypothetical protein BGW39_004022 [Mortierella sp. 14UC]